MVKTLCFLVVFVPTCALADPGDLLLTIPNPDGPNQLGAGLFGASLATYGDLLLVGAPGTNLGLNSGSAFLFDIPTGDLLLTIRNPNPSPLAPAHFGASVDFLGTNLIVGSPIGGLGSSPDPTYVFDGQSGEQLFAVPSTSDNFGSAVIGLGDNFAVGAPDDLSGAGAVYVYDGATGEQIKEIPSPSSFNAAGFGTTLATTDKWLVVGAPEGVGDLLLYLNSGCFNYVWRLQDPNPERNGQFAAALDGLGQNVLIGAPPTSIFEGGAAYLMKPSGDLVISIFDDNPGFGMTFGEDIAAVGDNFAVSAPGTVFGGGDIYLFDGETGGLLLTLDNVFSFGGTVTGIGNNIAIATPSLALGKTQTVRIYQGYVHAPEPTTLISLAIAISCLALYTWRRRTVL